METYHYIIVLVLGLVLGSFFNVIIFRFNSKKGVVKGRSRCFGCGSVIRWFDLIPVLSYLLLRGRCRKCGTRISPLYPVVETVTAVSLFMLFLNVPSISYSVLVNASIIAILVLIIFLDIRYLVIPDRVLIFLAVAAVISKFLADDANFYRLLISAFGLTSVFAILFLVSKGKWIGFGDVKLIFLIGFLMGYPAGYLSVLTAVWLAAIFSIILLLAGKVNSKTEIPFGSFLSISVILFLTFNNELQEISKYFI